MSSPAVPPSSAAPVVLLFGNISDATVCSTETITWTYAGNSSNFIAFSVNSDLTQATNSSAPQVSELLQVLNGSVTSQGMLAWQVIVPIGAYMLTASVSAQGTPGEIFPSASFFVRAGNDNSCLPASNISPQPTFSSSPSQAPALSETPSGPLTTSTYASNVMSSPSNMSFAESTSPQLTRPQFIAIIASPLVFAVILGTTVLACLYRRRRSRINGDDSFLD